MQINLMLYVLVISCYLHSYNIYAQETTQKQIDSLKKIVNSNLHDSIKIKAYFDWDYLIYVKDLELDFELNQKIQAISNKNIERIKTTKNDTNELKFFKYSLVKALNNQGLYYIEKNKPFDALVLFEKAFKIATDDNFIDLLSNITNNIGLIYNDINDYKNALKYYLKSIKFTNDSISNAPTLNNIGLCYLKLGNFSKAKIYFYKSLEYSLLANNLKNIGNVYSNLAEIYFFEKNQDSALYCISKGIETYTLTSDKKGLAYLNSVIGNYYLSNKDYNKSILNCRKSLAAALKYDFISIGSYACKCLYKSFKELKRIDSAFYYLEKYTELENKYYLEKSNSDLLKKQLQLEFDSKQKIAAAEHQKEIELFEERQKRQNILVVFSIVGIIGLIILLYLIYKSLKRYKYQNTIINKQKEIVEQKQKEILDSIQYAKRIQMALLTSEYYIEKNLKRLNK